MTQKQRTVVAVLHDLNLASTYCDHLILLKGGTIIAQGEPERVLTEEIIEKVYGIKPYIVRGVNNNRPYIIPFKK
jgi:iron complex transport system ATP-binding protein